MIELSPTSSEVGLFCVDVSAWLPLRQGFASPQSYEAISFSAWLNCRLSYSPCRKNQRVPSLPKEILGVCL
jgi:hypothetical protein